MKVVFESYLYPEENINDYKDKSKCILDYAAHNLCKAIYDGLKYNDVSVRLVNVPNIGSFPSYYKRPFVRGAKIKDGTSPSFCNITILKRLVIRHLLYKQICSEIQRDYSDNTVLLLYNYRCLPFIQKLKERWPNLKVVLIVTDLPGYMIMAPSRLMEIGGKLLKKKQSIANLDLVDGLVLLAPQMKERLRINIPWVQVEGIYNTDLKVGYVEKNPNKVVLYTGNLGLRYGLGKLLEAFNAIEDNNYRLWICGDGDGKQEVLRYTALDERIEYKGVLPREKVLRLQKEATILINPRDSKDEYTKYSFPSKTMEYLASGTPVVMSHLPSIPEEYDSYIFYVDDETVDGYRRKIVEVCSKSTEELMEFGKEASSFVYNNKTPKPQVKKILDLIETISIC